MRKEERSMETKPYSVDWFLQELVKSIFIAVSMLLLGVAATGILQAYLLPDRMDKESAKIQAKFDEQIKAAKDDAIKRESELIEQLNVLKKQYIEAIRELKNPNASPEFWNKFEKDNNSIDPEKSRMRWIQEHSVNQLKPN